MWPYFGSKKHLAKYYPHPKYDRIIEPFAGTAGYSLKHFEHDVTLIDKYDVIINIWKWLQQCSEADILGLPILEPGQDLRYINFDNEAARDFMAFLTQIGSAHRTYIMSSGAARERLPGRIKQTARSLYKIRHWKFIQGDYQCVANEPATWFIDPPYQFGGENYIKGNRGFDYPALAAWSRSREGQTIVCESTKATWMEFVPMRQSKSMIKNRPTIEAIWSNLPTAYDYKQTELFAGLAEIDK